MLAKAMAVFKRALSNGPSFFATTLIFAAQNGSRAASAASRAALTLSIGPASSGGKAADSFFPLISQGYREIKPMQN